MRRTLILALGLTLVSACTTAQPGGGGGQASAGAGGGSAGSSLGDAAAKVSDWCALIPTDVIQKFAPGASPASAGTYPGECVVSNGTGALDFRFNKGFGAFEVPSGTESVPGLADGAYLDRPSPDEVELWVVLQTDPDIDLFIDVAGHDGKDHQDDAVAIAEAIIAKLH